MCAFQVSCEAMARDYLRMTGKAIKLFKLTAWKKSAGKHPITVWSLWDTCWILVGYLCEGDIIRT